MIAVVYRWKTELITRQKCTMMYYVMQEFPRRHCPISPSSYYILVLLRALFYSSYCSFIMPPFFVIQEKDCIAIQMLLSWLKIGKETFFQVWDKMCVLRNTNVFWNLDITES